MYRYIPYINIYNIYMVYICLYMIYTEKEIAQLQCGAIHACECVKITSHFRKCEVTKLFCGKTFML